MNRTCYVLLFKKKWKGIWNKVEIGYNITKKTYFMSLLKTVVVTVKYNVVVKSEELIGTAEYLTL